MSDCKITVLQGDITSVYCDAIVNAANTSLLGGGGVDGAIHRAGGPDILEECRMIRGKQGGCKVGEAVITTAGKLNAKKVIHTVGPVWNGGRIGEVELLKNCYYNVLKLAVESNLKSIAIPNISTGIYKFPKELAAKTAVEEVKNFLRLSKPIDEIIFVCFDKENYDIYCGLLNIT